jgi:hypothetical protein
VYPDFADSHQFTARQTEWPASCVRLVSWELSCARWVADPVLAGLGLNPSGRHSRCRPTIGPDGYL